MKVAILLLGFLAVASARVTSSSGVEQGLEQVNDVFGDLQDKAKEGWKQVDKDIKKNVDQVKKGIKDLADKINKASKDGDLKKIFEKVKESIAEIADKIRNASDDVKEKLVQDVKTKLESIEKIIKFVIEKLKELKEDFKKNTTFSCNGTQCQVCRTVPGQIVGKNGTAQACIDLNLDLEDDILEVDGRIDDKVFFTRKILLNNAEALCKRNKNARLAACIRPYSVDLEESSSKICISNDIKFEDTTIVSLNLNCIEIVEKKHVYLVVGNLPQNLTGIFQFDGADLIPGLKKEGRIQLV